MSAVCTKAACVKTRCPRRPTREAVGAQERGRRPRRLPTRLVGAHRRASSANPSAAGGSWHCSSVATTASATQSARGPLSHSKSTSAAASAAAVPDDRCDDSLNSTVTMSDTRRRTRPLSARNPHSPVTERASPEAVGRRGGARSPRAGAAAARPSCLPEARALISASNRSRMEAAAAQEAKAQRARTQRTRCHSVHRSHRLAALDALKHHLQSEARCADVRPQSEHLSLHDGAAGHFGVEPKIGGRHDARRRVLVALHEHALHALTRLAVGALCERAHDADAPARHKPQLDTLPDLRSRHDE